MCNWPKHEDGRNKKIREMTPEESRQVFKASIKRVSSEFRNTELISPDEPARSAPAP